MKKQPVIVAERLRGLRDRVKLSQSKLAARFQDVDQPSIFRYESGQSFPPYGVLMQYADFFDVSLDYIFGRCDEPQGKLYDFQPKAFENDERMQDFIEMCFDPSSAANAKLKEAVLKLLMEQQK